jgi:hypothetical protein
MGGSGSNGGDKSNSRANGTPGHSKSASRQLSGDRPGKDGTAQRAAKEVDGLKGYVGDICL